jgi:LPPG:FO 2-phospho-L-lactate transferase
MKRVVYLSGGVGGARLLAGMAELLPAATLSAIVNVGDDFEHWGLKICPDLDTILYTLSGLSDMKRGWGLRRESFHTLELVQRYGGENWFQLGDRDLATHLMRSQWLREGMRLTEVTQRLARALGVEHAILPVSDSPLATSIETERDGTLDFQEWLVRRRGEPRVARVCFRGSALPTPEVCAALEDAELIVIGPSNPYVSIDPILAVPRVRALVSRRCVIAVSPIVAGRAVKGPLAEMIPALAGRPPSAAAIAAHYGTLLKGIVVEDGDEAECAALLPTLATGTVMRSNRERVRLARALLAFAEGLL